MRTEPIQLLNVDVVDAPLVIARVLLHKLVLLLVLVLLLAKPIIVELLFMHVIDQVDVVLDFLFVPHGYGVIFVGFEVGGGEDLVILPQFLAEHFVALDKVLADALANAVLALDGLLKQVLQHMVVVWYVRIEVDGIGL